MREASLIELAGSPHATRYRVAVLVNPHASTDGVNHGAGQLLPWDEVRAALAAEVGEPEGVRTVVFDLVVDGPDDAFHVRRLDADPGDDALALARIVSEALGPRAHPSIKSLAVDGMTIRGYPDLEEFEAAALESLEAGPS